MSVCELLCKRRNTKQQSFSEKWFRERTSNLAQGVSVCGEKAGKASSEMNIL